MEDVNALLKSCALEPVWCVRAELSDREDASVRKAVAAAVGLQYGAYEGVAFESVSGTQFFRPVEGSRTGEMPEPIEMATRILSFSVPRDPQVLADALEAIHDTHSYEEPVITVTEGWASRAHYSEGRDNPNRWWNRGFTP